MRATMDWHVFLASPAGSCYGGYYPPPPPDYYAAMPGCIEMWGGTTPLHLCWDTDVTSCYFVLRNSLPATVP